MVEVVSAKNYEQYIIPLAADAELRFGFAHGNREAANLEYYESFKERYLLEVIAPSQETANTYAQLAAWARKNGVALSNNDLWIAATSVQLNGKLLTLDQDFKRLPQLQLVQF